MKRGLPIILVLTGILAGGAIFHLFFGANSPSACRLRIVWHGDAATTATVIWDQVRGGKPEVCYGLVDFGRCPESYPLRQPPTRTVPGYLKMNTCIARLTGLQADSSYYFVIRDSTGVSERYWFKTAPQKPKPFTFIAGGDTKSKGTAYQATCIGNRMVARLRPLFILFIGDYCNGDGTNAARWQRWLTDWAEMTPSRDGRIYPIVPVHGNHENGQKDVLHQLFGVPYQHGETDQIYYTMEFGGFLGTVVLNSLLPADGRQDKWLAERLADYQALPFTITASHQPFFPHTHHSEEKKYLYDRWAQLFFKYGVDISVDGDSHVSKITYPLRPEQGPGSHQGFIRDDQHGTMFIGEGSWGATPRLADDAKPWTLRCGQFNQFKWIHVYPAQGEKSAYLDIHTVITASFTKDGEIEDHVKGVGYLHEADLFAKPPNIKLFSTSKYGPAIRYPFSGK